MGRGQADLETFSTLLESVYESAGDPDHWKVFLEGLAGALNAKSGLFRLIDERGPALRAGIEYNLDPELQQAYREYYVQQDPVVEALSQRPDVYIAPGEAFLDQKELEHTEFFNEYAQPQDNVHLCGGLAMRNEEFTIKFGVQRDRATGPFSKADADFIRRFVPHIQRAARLGHLLDLSEQRNTAIEQALESLAVGMILLDERGGILHANSRADETLRSGSGLESSCGHLVATGAADARRLRDILAAMALRARGEEAAVPEPMLLTPEGPETRLLLVACPIPPHRPLFRGPWPEIACAVFLSDLHDAGLLNHDILQSLYGLTPAEARLACALSRGRDLSALSDEWQVSRETLRTHLKHVLAKTDTKRQADLVRLLAGAPWKLASQGTNGGEDSDAE